MESPAMTTPTVYEIRIALETALFAALTPAFESGEIVIVQPGEEIAPDLKKIQVIHNVNPGAIQSGELDPRGGIAPRLGVYTILLSCPNDVESLTRTWEIAGELEKSLRGRELAAGECGNVYVGEVTTTNVGQTPDNRLGLSLSADWWAWAGGYTEE